MSDGTTFSKSHFTAYISADNSSESTQICKDDRLDSIALAASSLSTADLAENNMIKEKHTAVGWTSAERAANDESISLSQEQDVRTDNNQHIFEGIP